MKSILNFAAAAFAILAAGLWWKASVVYAPPSTDGGGAQGGATLTVTDDKGRRYDPFDTAARQSEWNRWAAMAASAAAFLQAVALVVPDACPHP